MEYSSSALVLEYHFLSTRTWLELVLEGQGTRAKKAPSTRVHLAFAGSSKQD